MASPEDEFVEGTPLSPRMNSQYPEAQDPLAFTDSGTSLQQPAPVGLASHSRHNTLEQPPRPEPTTGCTAGTTNVGTVLLENELNTLRRNCNHLTRRCNELLASLEDTKAAKDAADVQCKALATVVKDQEERIRQLEGELAVYTASIAAGNSGGSSDMRPSRRRKLKPNVLADTVSTQFLPFAKAVKHSIASWCILESMELHCAQPPTRSWEGRCHVRAGNTAVTHTLTCDVFPASPFNTSTAHIWHIPSFSDEREAVRRVARCVLQSSPWIEQY